MTCKHFGGRIVEVDLHPDPDIVPFAVEVDPDCTEQILRCLIFADFCRQFVIWFSKWKQ